MSTLQLVTAQPVVRICANPGCEKRIKENPKGGRPRRYCTEACKRANAAKVRSARSRISQNRASLAEQSRAAGLGEIPSPAEVKSTMESLHAVADNIADASRVLRAHTRDWADQPDRRSPDGLSAEELLRIIDRDVYDLVVSLRASERALGRKFVNGAFAHLDRIRTAAQDLVRMYNVAVPPRNDLTIRARVEDPSSWYHLDEPLPVVERRDRGDDFDD